MKSTEYVKKCRNSSRSARINELFFAGKNPKEIAGELRISLTTVYRYVDIKKSKKDLKQRIFKAYRSGRAPKQIAADFDVPLMRVYRYLKEKKGDKSKLKRTC